MWFHVGPLLTIVREKLFHQCVTRAAARHGTRSERRRLENSRRAVERDRAAPAGTARAPAGLSPTTRAGSRSDERDPVRTPHWLSVERAERHADLLELVRASTVCRVDSGWC